MKAIVSAFFAICIATSVGWCNLLIVPSQHATITEAITASMSGDTVLLLPGMYCETVPFPHALTFASNWALTNDSAFIATTCWSPAVDSLFTTMVHRTPLQLAGIRFLPNGEPRQGVKILRGDSLYVTFDHCWFEGVFDSVANYSDAYIHSSAGSRFSFMDCRFVGDWSGGRPYVRIIDGMFTMSRCTIKDRVYRHPGYFAIRTDGDSTKISDCYFSFDGWGLSLAGAFEVSHCNFVRTATYSIMGISQDQRTKIIRNCLFDSCRTDPALAIVASNTISPLVLENCLFRNCYGSSGSSFGIIDASFNVMLHRVSIQNATSMQRVIASRFIALDSCRFENTPLLLTLNSGLPGEQVTIQNSDFIRCSALISANVPPQQFDSVEAFDCYWGSSTGPNHPLNPNGQGMNLPFYVNPFPFRTTPVFPENGVNDPGTVSYSLPNSIVLNAPYPNPFNNETVIRFSLPRSTDAAVAVYDVTGREVASLASGWLPAGDNVVRWNPILLSSGSYYVRLSTPTGQFTQPVTYLK